MIHLRNLKKEDAPFMLEWMKDSRVTSYLDGDFSSFKIEDCEKYIFASVYKISRRDFAIADENDEYLGFAALKNIDDDDKTAEISIALRKKAEGQGIAKEALRQLIRLGFYGIGLDVLYSCTKKDNLRAIALFRSLGFKEIESPETEMVKFSCCSRVMSFS